MSGSVVHLNEPLTLGPMPLGRALETVDEQLVRAPLRSIFTLVRDVEHGPAYLPHYRWVRFRERARDGGGIVEMAAICAWENYRARVNVALGVEGHGFYQPKVE